MMDLILWEWRATFVIVFVSILFVLSVYKKFVKMNGHGNFMEICTIENMIARKCLARNVSVILLAGGKGSRMMASESFLAPKQYWELKGKQVVYWSFDVFVSHLYTSEIIIVCDEDREEQFLREYGNRGLVLKFARPGFSRKDSVISGFEKVSDLSHLVAVHDSARPLISRKLFTEVCNDASEFGAAILAVPCKSTIKLSDDFKMFVEATPERECLWEAQTPQVFHRRVLEEGIKRRANAKVTDDASMVEGISKIKLTMSEYFNIKITTVEDFLLAESLIEKRTGIWKFLVLSM